MDTSDRADRELFHPWRSVCARCLLVVDYAAAVRLRRMAASWDVRPPGSGVGVVNVRRLRNAAAIHHPLGGELARGLVPPYRAGFALLLHELGVFLQELAHELGVLGFIEAARKHHRAIPMGVTARAHSSIVRLP